MTDQTNLLNTLASVLPHGEPCAPNMPGALEYVQAYVEATSAKDSPYVTALDMPIMGDGTVVKLNRREASTLAAWLRELIELRNLQATYLEHITGNSQ